MGTMTGATPDVMDAASIAYKVLLENDRVRVMEVRLKPGEKAPMHNHPNDHVVYVVKDARFKLTTPEGKVDTIDLVAGKAIWLNAGPHSTENVGSTEGCLVVVEVKK